MKNNFVNKDLVNINTELHSKRYRFAPSEHIVRLVQWFFKTPGRVLDYGCGDGSNMEFLLDKKYIVDGIEITNNVIELIKKRLKGRSDWSVKLLFPEDSKLPYVDNQFDYIISNQVIYYLGSEEKISMLMHEFRRVLKPGGKIIITTMSRFNDGCTKGRLIENNVYEWKMGPTGKLIKVYIFRDENHIKKVMNMFEITEVGYMDNYYCGVGGHHWVILAKNNIKEQKIA